VIEFVDPTSLDLGFFGFYIIICEISVVKVEGELRSH